MVRAGLGESWTCRFAKGFDHKKGAAYRTNWEPESSPKALKTADVKTLTTGDLPGKLDLAWASFPCEDLSLTGETHPSLFVSTIAE
ncbi:site-specific DNA-cytosine methylase [Bradyrhizobium sp. AZCC 1577]